MTYSTIKQYQEIERYKTLIIRSDIENINHSLITLKVYEMQENNYVMIVMQDGNYLTCEKVSLLDIVKLNYNHKKGITYRNESILKSLHI